MTTEHKGFINLIFMLNRELYFWHGTTWTHAVVLYVVGFGLGLESFLFILMLQTKEFFCLFLFLDHLPYSFNSVSCRDMTLLWAASHTYCTSVFMLRFGEVTWYTLFMWCCLSCPSLFVYIYTEMFIILKTGQMIDRIQSPTVVCAFKNIPVLIGELLFLCVLKILLLWRVTLDFISFFLLVHKDSIRKWLWNWSENE